MPRAKRKNFETFSDGILSICETKERTLVRTKMQGVRFGHIKNVISKDKGKNKEKEDAPSGQHPTR